MSGVAYILAAVFWSAVGLLAYSYLLYPLLLGVLARRRGRPWQMADIEPTVTLLIPAHNEAKVIAAKIQNALSLDYPRGRLQIRVISDGSVDGTDEIVQRYAGLVEYQRISPRGGKPSAINQAMPYARGEILLLCDANTMFARDAVRKLVRHFADPDVGAVSGDVILSSDAVTYGRGEGLFWRMERYMQLCEGLLWTTVGVDGGMYALRRELYVPNRPDTLVDDFVIAMNVARAGRRVVLDPQAKATEDSVSDPCQEFHRRARTTAGGFQTLFEGRGRPELGRPALWLAYVSHKVLRWIGPALLATALAANVALVGLTWSARSPSGALYAGLLTVQGVFYALAAVGHGIRRHPLPRVVSVPYYFSLANLAAAAGFVKWLLKRQSVTWVQADRTVPAQAVPMPTARERAA